MLFKTTKSLIKEIEEFFDIVSEGALIFRSAINDYLSGDMDNFHQRLSSIDDMEGEADRLRRSAENNLYGHSLIPEHRGDVLGLLETMDDVIDTAKTTLFKFDIETPVIPEELNQKFKALAESTSNSVFSLIKSSRVFFRDPKSVKDHLHEVYFYEKESDKMSQNLKRFIFNEMDLELSKKMQLRYFAEQIDKLADKAEDVADRLSIYSIKQSI